MALDRQFDDLCDLYDQKSDGELLALHAQRGDLTEVAQQALAQVIGERKLNTREIAGNKLSVPEPAEDVDDDLLGLDEAFLAGFSDAFRCSEALRLLTEADIPHRVIDFNALPAEGEGGRPLVDLGIVTTKVHYEAARSLLQEKMNITPEAEGDISAELEGLMAVGVFALADALLVAHALGVARISYVWNDGKGVEKLPDDDVLIEVDAKRLDRAQAIAQSVFPEG